MRAWRRRLGRVVLLLAVFGSGSLGARLGLGHAPVAPASDRFGDVPGSAFYPGGSAPRPNQRDRQA